MRDMTEPWPALPYEEWRPTRDTLHMYAQIVGKLRLALSPFEPEWANVPLYVTARGLSTSPMLAGSTVLDAELDLLDHALILRTSDGRVERRPLGGAVADLYADVVAALQRLDIPVQISDVPSEVADPIPFPDDRTHDTYVPEHAARFQHVLSMVDIVMKRHHARFVGRSTPVHFFWGSFDLAMTRFSGRPASPPPHSGIIIRYSDDAEQICAGWWPGDAQSPFPAFYSYVYPPPDGIDRVAVEPPPAGWSPLGEFVYRYDDSRSAADPEAAMLSFMHSTYEAAASLAGWDRALTRVHEPHASQPAAGGGASTA
jgi:hypothetical protein